MNLQDISQKWYQFTLRLQRIGRTQHMNKCKLIKLAVVVDEDGQPLIWGEPKVTPIEPGNGAKDWIFALGSD